MAYTRSGAKPCVVQGEGLCVCVLYLRAWFRSLPCWSLQVACHLLSFITNDHSSWNQFRREFFILRYHHLIESSTSEVASTAMPSQALLFPREGCSAERRSVRRNNCDIHLRNHRNPVVFLPSIIPAMTKHTSMSIPSIIHLLESQYSIHDSYVFAHNFPPRCQGGH